MVTYLDTADIEGIMLKYVAMVTYIHTLILSV